MDAPGFAPRSLRASVSYRLCRASGPRRNAVRAHSGSHRQTDCRIDGQFIGELGHFGSKNVSFINAQPRAFKLPTNLHSGPITIAIRMWMDRATPLMAADSGGLHGVPQLGQADLIDSMLEKA
jgi:hypothetical protein